MRFMILVKAMPQAESGAVPKDQRLAATTALTAYHAQLVKAGVLLDSGSLQPSATGWRMRYAAGKRSVIDGPFPDDGNELVAGYTLIQVRSRDEALEWTRRFPAPYGDTLDAEIEVRQLFELDAAPPRP